jgi:glycosyltransferase involved in cell wall biosynthesis
VKILLLHGWLLERSGSNVYTASLARQWAMAGHEVHLFCQERHPDRYPFISRSLVYPLSGEPIETRHEADEMAGSCTLYRADIGTLLPVFNLDEYEGFTVVKRFVDMSQAEVESYLEVCVRVLHRIVKDNPVDVAFANHVIPNPTILARLKDLTKTPFVVFPHGSAIEYAVKKSDYLKSLAREALDSADKLIVGNQIVTERIYKVFPERADDWKKKHEIVSVGVDIGLFHPVDARGRSNSIETLLAMPNPGNGKVQAQVQEMCKASESVGSDQELLDLVNGARGTYHYTSPDADLADQLARVNWDEDEILLYVGKLIAGKGVHDLILALPELLMQRPNLKVVVVGESTFRESLELLLYALGNERADLVERILRLGWALDQREPVPLSAAQAYVQKIGMSQLLEWGAKSSPQSSVFFTGYLNHARFSKLLPCADISVFPSEIAEAYPLVLLESICAGVLPMGAYFEGLKDGVDTISEGLSPELREAMRLRVEPEQKVADLVRKVPVLLDEAARVKSRWATVAGEYSWDKVAARLADVMGSSVEKVETPRA